MDNRKLLLTLNALVCVVILLHIYSLAGASANAPGTTTNTATGGSVSSTISVAGDNAAMVDRAEQRGHFTAKEYAEFEGVNLETIYRRLDAGLIEGAEKVGHRWQIPFN